MHRLMSMHKQSGRNSWLLGILISVFLLGLSRLPLVAGFWSHLQVLVGQMIHVSIDPIAGYISPVYIITKRINLARRLQETELKLRALEAREATYQMQNDQLEALKASLASGIKESHPNLLWRVGNIITGDGGQVLTLGKNAGIREGATLVYQDAFVGKVEQVEAHHSVVLTVLSPRVRFAVRTIQSNVEGVLSRDTKGRLIFTTLYRTDKKIMDEKLVTLGWQDGELANLFVGKVEAELTKPQDSVSRYKISIPIENWVGKSVLVNVEKP